MVVSVARPHRSSSRESRDAKSHRLRVIERQKRRKGRKERRRTQHSERETEDERAFIELASFLPSFLRFGYIHLNAAARGEGGRAIGVPFLSTFSCGRSWREPGGREGVRECRRGRHRRRGSSKKRCQSNLPPLSFLPSLFLRLSLSFSLSQTCMQINISCNAWKVSLYKYSGFLHPSFKPAGTKGIAYTSSKRKLDP